MAKWFAPIFMLISLLGLCTTLSMGYPFEATHSEDMIQRNQQEMAVQGLIEQVAKYLDLINKVRSRHDTAIYLSNAVQFCGHHNCTYGHPFFDTENDVCVCPWAPSTTVSVFSPSKYFPKIADMVQLRHPALEERLHPAAKCAESLECTHPLLPVFNPFKSKCVCSLYTFPLYERFWLDERKPMKTDTSKKDGVGNETTTPSRDELLALKLRHLVQLERRALSAIPGYTDIPY